MSLMEFFPPIVREKHDIIVLPAGLVTVTYNCKNVIAPECEGLLQIVEMLVTNKVKKKKRMVEKEGQKMDKVSVVCVSVSPPCKPGTGLCAEQNKHRSKPILKQGHKRSIGTFM